MASGSGWNLWVWLVGVVSRRWMWVESMGVVSRRWVWVESMGVASGCSCKEVYRFPHTTYSYSSCICSLLQQHPYFCSFFNVFLLHYKFKPDVRMQFKNTIVMYTRWLVCMVCINYMCVIWNTDVGPC